MLGSQWMKDALAIRRESRDMKKLEAEGWEYVDDSGGKLWELDRGWRTDHRIVEAKVSRSGKGVWVRIEKRPRQSAALIL